jgi:hypothetical protein
VHPDDADREARGSETLLARVEKLAVAVVEAYPDGPVSNNEMDSYSPLTVVTPTSTVTADWASKEGAATNIAASAAEDADKLGRLLQAVFKRRSGHRESLTGAGPPGLRTR